MLAFVIVGLMALFIALVIIQRTAIGPDVNNALAEGGLVAKIVGKWARKQFREYRPEAMKFGYLLVGAHVGVAAAAFCMSFMGASGTAFSTPLWASAIVWASAIASAVLIAWTIRKPKGQESLLALMGVSASVTIGTGVITLVVSAVTHSSPLGFLAFPTLVGGLVLAWVYARGLVGIGVKIADLAEGVINTAASFLRLLAHAFDKEKLASMIKDANPFDEDAYIDKTNRFFRPLLGSAAAVTLANALLPDEYHLAILMAASAYTEVNCFRFESQGMDATNRRRNSVILFDGWTFILLLNYMRELVFLKHPDIRTTYWLPIVNAMKTIATAAIENVFWLVAAGACALAIKFLPRLFDAESKRLRGIAHTFGGLLLLTCLAIFAWNMVQKPITEKTTAMTERAWAEFTPTVEADAKKPSVTVSWLPLKTDHMSAYRVERREIKETNFTSLADLAVGASAWDDDGVVRGKTYFYRITIIDSRGVSLTTRERKITIPDAPVAASTAAKTAVPTAHTATPIAKNACTGGGCGKSSELSELCARFPASCQ